MQVAAIWAEVLGVAQVGLSDHFFQCELGNGNRIFSLNIRQIRKIFTGFTGNIEFCFFTGNERLKVHSTFNHDFIIRKLSYDI